MKKWFPVFTNSKSALRLEVNMHKLTKVTVATLFLLFTTALLSGQVSEPETEVSGPVSSATLAFINGSTVFLGAIPGLPIGDQVSVEWDPTVGAKGEIQNKTQNTQAECTVVSFTTPAPSNRLRCTVTESNIAGIGVGDTLQVTINFSSASFVFFSAPGLGGDPNAGVFLGSNEVCIKNITLSTGTDLATARIEAK